MVNYRHLFLGMLNRLGTYYQRRNLTDHTRGRFCLVVLYSLLPYIHWDGLYLFVPHFILQQFKINSANSIVSEEKNELWFVCPFSHMCSVILFKFELSLFASESLP